MSTTAKVVLIIVSALGLLLVLVIGTGVYWWTQHGEEFVERSERAQAEGRAFGPTTDATGCLEEALARDARCDGLSCQVAANLFLESCLAASTASSGFCDGVPPESEMMKSVEWRASQCAERGRTGSGCSELFARVQEYCSSPQN